MRVAFITCPRTGADYLKGAIDSCLEMGSGVKIADIGVFSESLEPPVGVPEGAYVECRSAEYMAKMPQVHSFAEKDWRGKNACARCISTGRNAVRASRWAAQDGQYGCVVEDDVVFAKNWDGRAIEMAGIAKGLAPEFAMTLLQFYQRDHFPKGVKAGPFELVKWRDPFHYWGSQGIVYEASAARKIGDWREKQCNEAEGKGWDHEACCNGDQGLKFALLSLKLPLYSMWPNVIKHVGAVSAWANWEKMFDTDNFWKGD